MVIKNQMKKDPMAKWAIEHEMYNFGVGTPFEYFEKANKFQIFDIASKIIQDFLLIGAEKDHFISVNFCKDEIEALNNVKSMTYRIFTDEEQASNHCNAGNTKLVLDFIMSWIKNTKKDI